jgi:hypothetical protein
MSDPRLWAGGLVLLPARVVTASFLVSTWSVSDGWR